MWNRQIHSAIHTVHHVFTKLPNCLVAMLMIWGLADLWDRVCTIIDTFWQERSHAIEVRVVWVITIGCVVQCSAASRKEATKLPARQI